MLIFWRFSNYARSIAILKVQYVTYFFAVVVVVALDHLKVRYKGMHVVFSNALP